jgi:diguanylate cyclase (GGDEF)-like protein
MQPESALTSAPTTVLAFDQEQSHAPPSSEPAVSIPPASSSQRPSRSVENQLVQVRLGIASSLFTSLRQRHFDTAAHSLRVTLGCASWALSLDLSSEQRDIIEVAALLHDIGKIGVPDRVLLKPSALTPDEMAIMDQHRRMGVEILRASCASPAILDIVGWSNAWYGGKPGAKLVGADIPLGARMLSIVDAFDAMTSEQVYRSALSRERAFSELFRYAGTQFDPDLVKIFAALHECDQGKLHEAVARRWLEDLDVDRVHGLWRLNESPPTGEPAPELLFQQKLLDNMRDAVIFVDVSQRVIHWNSGAERMTGIAAASVFQHSFSPRLLNLRDDDGGEITDAECPVTRAMHTGEQRILRLILRGRNRKDVNIEAHIVPVGGGHGSIHGAALLMRDVSPQLSLEARCHSLHQLATKDPLTQVANRAEFNRVHEMFVAAHLERKLPCSLIICDLDRFKSVNDTYGHPAGDEVLQSFAKLLKTSCRPGDLVARYGGEEFAMLCADCGNATAARRAEDIRRNWSEIPHSCLNSKCLTASFGVTEIQLGDTPSTMLSRADRALYDAKEGGRNKVVQLGTGIGGEEEEQAPAVGKKKAATQTNYLAEQHLVTLVPIALAIEKLRGFVADHQAELVSIEGSDVRLKIGQSGPLFFRRSTDQQVPFIVDLHFEEDKRGEDRKPLAGGARTRIYVTVTPQRNRDRRRGDAAERARMLLSSFRAYLMATEDPQVPEPPLPRRGKTMLLPWLRKKQR